MKSIYLGVEKIQYLCMYIFLMKLRSYHFVICFSPHYFSFVEYSPVLFLWLDCISFLYIQCVVLLTDRSFCWGDTQRRRKKAAMIFECLSALLWPPKQPFPLRLVFVVSLSFLNLSSTRQADVAARARPHSLFTSVHHGFDLLRNNSRFPPLWRVPSSHVL